MGNSSSWYGYDVVRYRLCCLSINNFLGHECILYLVLFAMLGILMIIKWKRNECCNSMVK